MKWLLFCKKKYSSSYDILDKENVNFTKLKLKLNKESIFAKFDFEHFNNLKDILK